MNTKQQQILNLASDLRRIAWWACDQKNDRNNLIEKFLNLCKKQISELNDLRLQKIINRKMITDWQSTKKEARHNRQWAEAILTASLRLKHRTEINSFTP